MFWEQYNHEPNIATLRFWRAFVGEAALSDAQRAQLPAKAAAGEAALALMDEQLGRTAFLVGDRPTLADLAVYAYTHVADEGGFELARFAEIGRWLDAVAQLPGYVPLAA